MINITDVSRGRLYVVHNILYDSPDPNLFLYKLEDLMGDKIEGYYYKKDLLPAAVDKDTFLKREVERVLAKKKNKQGQMFALVKFKVSHVKRVKFQIFLYKYFQDYDNSFSQWLPFDKIKYSENV